MIDRTYLVLFLCTSNSAQSLLAENALNRFGAGRFRAISAGTQPAAHPHPLALQVLGERGNSIGGLRCKPLSEYCDANAARLDFVITLCDAVRGAAVAHWPGRPLKVHWSVPGPLTSSDAPPEQQVAAFRAAYHEIERRIRVLANLRVEEIERPVLESILKQIGTGAPVRLRAA